MQAWLIKTGVPLDTPGRIKPIKNLGWLLRNWQAIEAIEITVYKRPSGALGECALQAFTDDGRMYVTDWTSYALCLEWLDRSIFRQRQVIIHTPTGSEYRGAIGDPGYRAELAAVQHPSRR